MWSILHCLFWPHVGHAFISCSLALYFISVETTVACDHVSGETDKGAFVYGCTCSASTPDSKACSATQSNMGSASLSSSGDFAFAMRHSASHSVQINHGFPGTFSMSSVTAW